ncbi:MULTISPECIES: GNAT family N-acetyltransferase [Cohnella]|uniref:GNAT family N-acetyltransferase n=1 Tax=Cohnella TaxID=329857 RepID=UPI0009BB6A43|nr:MULTISPECIES: GNAT family N-acetyltransferase [Cohnella]MBN2980005.1 GNAT family N-acetyltransferase [Cohnella algarum]
MIRWKRKGDNPGIIRLVRAQLVPISPWYDERDKNLDGIIARRIRGGYTFVVSRVRSGAPIAFVHFIVRGELLFIDLLAVDGASQGRGWGTELMRRAESFGRSRGCSRVRLYVDEGNAKGLRFYLRLGYETVRHAAELRAIELAKPL